MSNRWKPRKALIGHGRGGTLQLAMGTLGSLAVIALQAGTSMTADGGLPAIGRTPAPTGSPATAYLTADAEPAAPWLPQPSQPFPAGVPVPAAPATPEASLFSPQAVGVSGNFYPKTGGLGGGFAVAADTSVTPATGVSVALFLGFAPPGGGGAEVKATVYDAPTSLTTSAGVFGQLAIPSFRSSGQSTADTAVPDDGSGPAGAAANLGLIQLSFSKASFALPLWTADQGFTLDPGNLSATMQFTLKADPIPGSLQYSITGKPFASDQASQAVGSDATTQVSDGGVVQAASAKLGPSVTSGGVFLHFGEDYPSLIALANTLNNAAHWLQQGGGLTIPDDMAPTTRQDAIDTFFPQSAAPQTGVMPAPAPAPGVEPVPYLNTVISPAGQGSTGPVNPITGVPDSADGVPGTTPWPMMPTLQKASDLAPSQPAADAFASADTQAAPQAAAPQADGTQQADAQPEGGAASGADMSQYQPQFVSIDDPSSSTI